MQGKSPGSESRTRKGHTRAGRSDLLRISAAASALGLCLALAAWLPLRATGNAVVPIIPTYPDAGIGSEESSSDTEDTDGGEGEEELDGGDDTTTHSPMDGGVAEVTEGDAGETADLEERGSDSTSQNESDADSDDDAVKVSYRVEVSAATNSVWRGMGMWKSGLVRGAVGTAELQLENLGRFDITADVWAGVPLKGWSSSSAHGGGSFVPSLSSTFWFSEQLYAEVGYAVYLDPVATHLDYEHDILGSLGGKWVIARGTSFWLALAEDTDPLRRRGLYLHGDAMIEIRRSPWLAQLMIEAGVSRYHGTDAVPWGLQTLMGTLSLRHTLLGPIYVVASGSLAYSGQAKVWDERPLNPAFTLGLGAQH